MEAQNSLFSIDIVYFLNKIQQRPSLSNDGSWTAVSEVTQSFISQDKQSLVM